MAEKVYTPEVIVDVGFPQSAEGVTGTVTQGGSGSVSTPKVTQPGVFPKKMVAKELLSTVFNTVSKKILGAFEFAKSGAIQIGEYIAGVSGDIRISPAGIVARNKAGATTFALDGETGDGTFQGTIRASKFESDYFQVDEEGNVIAQSIKIIDQSTTIANGSLNQEFTSGVASDVTGGSITVILERSTILLINADLGGHIHLNTGATPYLGNGLIRLDIDGSEVRRTFISGGVSATGDGIGHGSSFAATIGSASLSYLATLSAGTHTIKLTGACDQVTGSSKLVLYSFYIQAVTLGNS